MLAHEVAGEWGLQSPELLDGVARLCLHKVRALQEVLASCSSQYVHTRWLQEHLGSARTLHRSIDKDLSRQKSKMSGHVTQVLRWVTQLRQSLQRLPAADASSVQQTLQSVGLSTGNPHVV